MILFLIDFLKIVSRFKIGRFYTRVNVHVIRYDRWRDDLRFLVLFNSISAISGRLAGDNERLCALESRL